MQTFTAQQAQAALALAHTAELTPAQVADLLAGASVTFANVIYATQQQNAAEHKGVIIHKVTSANVMLCSNIRAHTSVYANRVRRSARGFDTNSTAAVEAFEPAAATFTHTDCYSIVQNIRVPSKHYLYAIFNNSQSIRLQAGCEVSREYAQQFLTPSARAAANSKVTHNRTHNITHDVVVRTIALSNVVSIRARRQILALA